MISASEPRVGDPGPAPDTIRVVFVSTGNAARSQMAEAILRRDGGERFRVVSGGVTPRPVDPMAIKSLAKVDIDIAGAKPKPVAGFLGQRFDYVITVCDRARVTCPVFPGGSETLHWGVDDPAQATGTDEQRQAAHDQALRELAIRIHTFIPLAVGHRR